VWHAFAQVQKLLKEKFPAKVVSTKLDPDLAVAQGAAVQAAQLCGDRPFSVLDITPLDFCVHVSDGAMVRESPSHKGPFSN
jgi:molecular chaperone DnaK (HSP70)